MESDWGVGGGEDGVLIDFWVSYGGISSRFPQVCGAKLKSVTCGGVQNLRLICANRKSVQKYTSDLYLLQNWQTSKVVSFLLVSRLKLANRGFPQKRHHRSTDPPRLRTSPARSPPPPHAASRSNFNWAAQTDPPTKSD